MLAVVAPVHGAALDPAELLAFLPPRLAHFMVPRYVRVLPALPKTPTQKVQKNLLRAEGVTADTWDREAAGIRIRRERLRSWIRTFRKSSVRLTPPALRATQASWPRSGHDANPYDGGA